MTFQLVYLSTATRLLAEPQLEEILAVSRRNNSAVGVTGMLLYADGQFMQVLEGPPDAVAATFARVRRDPRHRDLIEMLRRDIPEPDFADWAMGYARRGREALTDLPGWTDFLERADDDTRADVARSFLRTFRASAQRFRL